jgi:hypothetical protein
LITCGDGALVETDDVGGCVVGILGTMTCGRLISMDEYNMPDAVAIVRSLSDDSLRGRRSLLLME